MLSCLCLLQLMHEEWKWTTKTKQWILLHTILYTSFLTIITSGKRKKTLHLLHVTSLIYIWTSLCQIWLIKYFNKPCVNNVLIIFYRATRVYLISNFFIWMNHLLLNRQYTADPLLIQWWKSDERVKNIWTE